MRLSPKNGIVCAHLASVLLNHPALCETHTATHNTVAAGAMHGQEALTSNQSHGFHAVLFPKSTAQHFTSIPAVTGACSASTGGAWTSNANLPSRAA